VVVFTSSEAEPPETATDLVVVRHDEVVDLPAALGHLREECGIRALLCEGGPHVHSQLWAEDLVDELFLTTAPRLTGAEGPRMLEGEALPDITELDLAWLLEQDGELFARYCRR
jgi:riboflavin biosynthesis pyrimidine reductase